MKTGSSRREVLIAAAGGACLLARAARATSLFGRAQGDGLAVTRLEDSLFVVSGAGGNVLVLSGTDGALLVDGGLLGRSSDLMRRVSRETGGQPARLLFNTHWHWDHTGSNARLAAAAAPIIAHENTKLWLGTQIVVDWEHRTYPPCPAAALPTRTFVYKPQSLDFSGVDVHYGYLPQAHTDGDIYVHFPQHNVLAAGDTVWADRYPIIDYSTGGWIGGLIDATRKLIALSDAQTRIVPGTGAVQSRADLQLQLQMCQAVQDALTTTYRKALDFEDLLAMKPTAPFDAHWGDPALFLRLAYQSVRGHERDLGGIF